MRKYLWLVVAAGALALAACHDDDDANPMRTTTRIAGDLIDGSTDDTGQPTEINALNISDADTDDTSLPGGV